MTSQLWNVPNLLSLSRLPLTVLVCVCVEYRWWVVGLAAFLVAAVTDWLDGWWARRFNQFTSIGRSLDPLTDKVMIGATFIFLIPVPEVGIRPWMVTVVIARELLITGLRGVVEASGKTFGADWFGKLKTVLQCVVLAAVFVVQTLRAEVFPTGLTAAADGAYTLLLYLMLAATVGSGVQYTVKAARLLR